jgi:hypothetical protein
MHLWCISKFFLNIVQYLDNKFIFRVCKPKSKLDFEFHLETSFSRHHMNLNKHFYLDIVEVLLEGAMILTIMTFSLTTLSIMTFSIMTISITFK